MGWYCLGNLQTNIFSAHGPVGITKEIWLNGSPLLDIIPQLLITLDLIQILSMAYEALLDLSLDSLLDFILYQASFFFTFQVHLPS